MAMTTKKRERTWYAIKKINGEPTKYVTDSWRLFVHKIKYQEVECKICNTSEEADLYVGFTH